ncbi:MAG: hypothetical protein HKN50_12510 [Gammaproteobacteria bacterium]|nr:hypothetical protein [Gammaproteobacteria bacterium]
MLAGAVYSEVADRTLIVDWRRSRYSDSGENTFYSLFNLKNIESTSEIPNTGDVRPQSWDSRLDLSMHQAYVQDGWESWDREKVIAHYSINFDIIDYEEEVTVSWDFDQIGKLLRHFPECQNIAQLFHYSAQKFLDVAPDIEREFINHRSKLPERYLGVHIRYTNEFAENKGLVEKSRYFEVIKKAVGRASQPFFLACDNEAVQRELVYRYPNAIVIEKWFSESGAPLHLNENCPDKLANAQSALTDILLLAHSSHLICNPNSCFSECAQYFSPHFPQSIRSVLPRRRYANAAAALQGKLSRLRSLW